ncbi:MAG: tetratricopeptide repeat protein, partial [Acidobacteriota bacterium]|nr:tetratricopeptide repeat protein [Acidobacteriota bacterium]
MLRRICFVFSLPCLLIIVAATTGWAQSSRAASADSYRQRGDQWQAKGEFDRAIEDYGLALVFNANDFDAYNNRGIAWRLKGDDARALEDFDQTLRLKPGDIDALYN